MYVHVWFYLLIFFYQNDLLKCKYDLYHPPQLKHFIISLLLWRRRTQYKYHKGVEGRRKVRKKPSKTPYWFCWVWALWFNHLFCICSFESHQHRKGLWMQGFTRECCKKQQQTSSRYSTVALTFWQRKIRWQKDSCEILGCKV